jgi:signal transduction histidine kinase
LFLSYKYKRYKRSMRGLFLNSISTDKMLNMVLNATLDGTENTAVATTIVMAGKTAESWLYLANCCVIIAYSAEIYSIRENHLTNALRFCSVQAVHGKSHDSQ